VAYVAATRALDLWFDSSVGDEPQEGGQPNSQMRIIRRARIGDENGSAAGRIISVVPSVRRGRSSYDRGRRSSPSRLVQTRAANTPWCGGSRAARNSTSKAVGFEHRQPRPARPRATAAAYSNTKPGAISGWTGHLGPRRRAPVQRLTREDGRPKPTRRRSR